MSMYNALFGVNPASGVLLAILGLKTSDVGRFRDAYVTEENGEPVIAIYTRNGGGNRECHCEYDPKYGTSRCKHHELEEMVDETVNLPYDRDNPDTLPDGYRWANVFMGSKRMAFTGGQVPKTFHVCEEPGTEACQCTGCWTEYHAASVPGYIRDEDDEFDSTYCTFYFRPPNDDWRDLLAGMVRAGDPDGDWVEFILALENPPEEPTSRPQKLAASVIASLKSDG